MSKITSSTREVEVRMKTKQSRILKMKKISQLANASTTVSSRKQALVTGKEKLW